MSLQAKIEGADVTLAAKKSVKDATRSAGERMKLRDELNALSDMIYDLHVSFIRKCGTHIYGRTWLRG